MIDGGWRVQVDEPDQIARYVFPYAGEPVRGLTKSTATALTPIKVCAAPDDVEPLLAPPWVIDRTSPMMRKASLEQTDASTAEGYFVLLTGTGEVLIALAVTGSGDIVAGGRVAIVGAIGVFDQIWTHEQHRRRRIGSAVMRRLENEAVTRGVDCGMLVATDVGCALYQTLGWTIYAPYTTAIVPHTRPNSAAPSSPTP